MDFLEVLSTRRSIRAYTDKPVSPEIVQDLLNRAVMAPSGSNGQPWKFCVIQSKDLLADISKKTKALLLSTLSQRPFLEKYRDEFINPDFNIFYEAATLVMILCESRNSNAEIDCALAAENLMLAARAKGIGSCWMGFGTVYCNQPEAKAELGIPEAYKVVAPIILGYPKEEFSTMERKAPEILFWKR